MRALALAAVLALAPVARPSARALEVDSGEVVLPLSGLVVDLPASAEGRWRVAGHYRLGEGGSYHAVDSIELWDSWDEWSDWLERWEVRHGRITSDCKTFLENEAARGGPGQPPRQAPEIVPHVLSGIAGTLMTELSPRRATFCATSTSESLVLGVSPSSKATTHEALRADLERSVVLPRVLAAYRHQRVRVEPPLSREDVSALAGSRAYPSPLRLPRLQAELTPPDDGFVWVHDKALSERALGDFIATVFPSASDIGIELGQLGRGPCEGAWARSAGTRTGEASVGAWSGELVVQQNGRFHEAWLCRAAPDRVLLARITAKAPLGELSRFSPILESIAQTLSTLPPPPARPGGPGRPGTSGPHAHPSAGVTDGFLFAQFGSELIVSTRDTAGRDTRTHPATRVTGPGLAMDFVYKIDGFLGRTTLAATWGWGGIFGSDATDAARWGASHLEAAFEFGFAFGDAFVVGLMGGWTGLSGPLTLNSSLSMSALVGMPPARDGDFGWLLRVTPVQLFAANERELLSPLMVDLHLLPVPGLGVTLGFQWIDAPRPGDEDIPAAGWSLALKIGSAAFVPAR